MKKIIEFFQSLFGRKKKPPVIVVPKPKPEQKPDPKPDIPIPEEKPIEPTKVWNDLRPIGMVMLANYLGWTGHENYMNGEEPFDQWILEHAKRCTDRLKLIGSQALIVWDPEGTKFPRAYSYYGDPKMTPEKVDPFFKAIMEAGFRTGVCLRP